MAINMKTEAINIVCRSVQLFEKHLANKKLLFLAIDKHYNMVAFEVIFKSHHFAHLTGLKLAQGISARDFYERCLSHKLTISDFSLPKDGTADMKLEVLPHVLFDNLNATMIGDFADTSFRLSTETLVGGVKACIGFKKAHDSDDYIPNTLLNTDLKKVVKKYYRIVTTYRKHETDERYSELVYKAKKVDWDRITYPEEYYYLPKPIIKS